MTSPVTNALILARLREIGLPDEVRDCDHFTRRFLAEECCCVTRTKTNFDICFLKGKTKPEDKAVLFNGELIEPYTFNER